MIRNEVLALRLGYSGVHILLLEDNPDMSELIADALVMEGHEVTCARTGAEGLRAIHQGPLPDLIITDLVMPVMDGITFIEHMRAIVELQHTPCLMISGDPSDRDRALMSGADEFLVKPFRYSELRKVMDALQA